jgi:predicted membrane-bound mannosyltransferase/DNA-binding beta-propeller fold protein YncE
MVFVTVLLLALFTRFYIVGARVMSHDESLHTKYSWQLYAGQGYVHNPMMHGPLLFHLTALSYFLFGVSDFASRIFPALAGVALVMSPWLFRKWLGRYGAIVASVLLLLSPSISYYSRYIRHDVFNMLAAVALLWAILRYLDTGKDRALYALAAAFAFLYITKETSYIYTAIFGVILAVPLIWRVFTLPWARPDLYNLFVVAVILTLLFGLAFAFGLRGAEVEEQALDEAGNTVVADPNLPLWARGAVALALAAGVAAAGLAFVGVGEGALRSMRLFDLVMVMGTLTLPLGSAIFIRLAGVDMTALANAFMTESVANLPTFDLVVTIVVALITVGVSALLGWWWDLRRWLIVAAVHYALFFIPYTTFFTNALGWISGPVGSLAYWLGQQGVKRGGQPGYYYLLLMPLYEFLPFLGSLVVAGPALLYYLNRVRMRRPDDEVGDVEYLDPVRFLPVFLVGWTLLAWVAYTIAGEKMPWLTVHLALPSILLTAWGVGRLVEEVRWRRLVEGGGWLLAVALPLVVVAWVVLVASLGDLIPLLREGTSPAGFTLLQLEAVGRAVGGLVAFAAFFALFVWAMRRAGEGETLRLAPLLLVVTLALLTLRSMVMLNFINYDSAREFLVYAHGAPDVKVALKQVEDVSWRATGDANEVPVAYGEHGSWPFSWYMVDYPNAYFYGASPDAERLAESPVVIAGSKQWEVVEPILANDYVSFDYQYLWWPIQDYYELTWERIHNALTDPALRAGLWDIIWDRDYRRYAQATGRSITTKDWPYHEKFRLYVRRDLASEIWSYRLGEAGVQVVQPEATPFVDPFGQALELPVTGVVSLPDAAPRDLAVAPDGTLYVVDTAGHRVWHVNRQGAVLNSWGGLGVEPGQFQEPWGVALDDGGHVYVADTWNARVQKFSPEGEFLDAWGTAGQFSVGDPNGRGAFFGPRGIAVGPAGYVYVTDTGNKRVQVFDDGGEFLWEFGGGGRNPGELNEPVGIAVDEEGRVYVADAWNQRVQALSSEGEPLLQWSLPVWSVEDHEEKPFLALGDGGQLYVSDPGHGRVLVFEGDGAFVGAVGSGPTLTFPMGVAVHAGALYVGDAHAGRVVIFDLP